MNQLISKPQFFHKEVHERLGVKELNAPSSEIMQKLAEQLARIYESPNQGFGSKAIRILSKNFLQDADYGEHRFLEKFSTRISDQAAKMDTLARSDDPFLTRQSSLLKAALDNAIATALGLFKIAFQKIHQHCGQLTKLNAEQFIEDLKRVTRENLDILIGFSQLHFHLLRKLFQILGDIEGIVPKVRDFHNDYFFELEKDSAGNVQRILPTKELQRKLIKLSSLPGAKYKNRIPWANAGGWRAALLAILRGPWADKLAKKKFIQKVPMKHKISPAFGCPAIKAQVEIFDKQANQKRKVNLIELVHLWICDLLDRVLDKVKEGFVFS